MRGVWKLYRKRRLPVLKCRPYVFGGRERRESVPLSRVCGRPLLPKHWTPKSDADGIVRLREELEVAEELAQIRYTIVW